MMQARSLVWVLGMCAACGGGTAVSGGERGASGQASLVVGNDEGPAKKPTTAGSSPAGGSDVVPAKPAASDAPKPAKAPTGPATVVITVKLADEKVAAPIKVLDLSGKVVAEGRAGAPITVPAGTYEFASEIDDPKVMLGAPKKKTVPRTVKAGETFEDTIELLASKVRLIIRKKGKEVRGAKVTLQREGSSTVVAEFEPTDEYVRVAAGRFDAVVTLKGEKINAKGLVFPAGAQRDVPIDIK